MPLPRKAGGGDEGAGWLASFGDLVTNLMVFFVMLISISTIDEKKLKAIAGAIQDEIGGIEIPERAITEDLIEDVNRLISLSHLEDVITVTVTPDGILLSAKGSAFFAPGSADLLPEAREKFTVIVEGLVKIPYHIEVIGHSDTVPIHTEQFPSNWELSGARATNLVRYFIEKGFAPNRIRGIAAADTRPVAPDYKEDGTPLPDNQAKNRRIDIMIFSTKEPAESKPTAPAGEASEEEPTSEGEPAAEEAPAEE
ncbi:MAG: flagellar motor protein MotB [Nitrospirae bacterium]|nr:flagellar motor protein MotB [Nitrospirota bacterium]